MKSHSKRGAPKLRRSLVFLLSLTPRARYWRHSCAFSFHLDCFVLGHNDTSSDLMVFGHCTVEKKPVNAECTSWLLHVVDQSEKRRKANQLR